MSALPVVTTVTSMQIVSTLLVLITVHVRKDILEMDACVQVCGPLWEVQNAAKCLSVKQCLKICQ